mgnify:FL=1
MKHRKEFLLDESTIALLESYRDENHLPTLTATLSEIIDKFSHRNDIPATDILVQGIAREVKNELSDTLTRIRLGSNNADRNSDIIIMLLNTLLSYQQFTSLVTKETPQLTKAKEIEKERISNFRQRKLERSKSKTDKEKNPKQLDNEEATGNIVDDDLIMQGR